MFLTNNYVKNIDLGAMAHFYDCRTWDVKEVQGHPQLYTQFEDSLGYMKTCLKKTNF